MQPSTATTARNQPGQPQAAAPVPGANAPIAENRNRNPLLVDGQGGPIFARLLHPHQRPIQPAAPVARPRPVAAPTPNVQAPRPAGPGPTPTLAPSWRFANPFAQPAPLRNQAISNVESIMNPLVQFKVPIGLGSGLESNSATSQKDENDISNRPKTSHSSTAPSQLNKPMSVVESDSAPAKNSGGENPLHPFNNEVEPESKTQKPSSPGFNLSTLPFLSNGTSQSFAPSSLPQLIPLFPYPTLNSTLSLPNGEGSILNTNDILLEQISLLNRIESTLQQLRAQTLKVTSRLPDEAEKSLDKGKSPIEGIHATSTLD